MDSKGTGRLGANWIHLAQDRDDWLALVDAIMNFLASIIRGEFLEWPNSC
jgi:hypothetical protein